MSATPELPSGPGSPPGPEVHWLKFELRPDGRHWVVGCQCGFEAHESDEGWGDSVVMHLMAQGVA